KRVLPDYDIMDDDRIEIAEFCHVSDVIESLDLDKKVRLTVNNVLADDKTEIYENFSVGFYQGAEEYDDLSDETDDTEETAEETAETESADSEAEASSDAEYASEESAPQKEPAKKSGVSVPVTVVVNKKPVTLTGKSEYVFVDVFDFIDFDLSKPQGKGVVTLHNGKPAQYMDTVSNGDTMEIYWKD
ncbi:MAG: hypothetical protein ILP13_06540, partial [Lachnospiraceae bacterium]|nr:hypothetical protein [Lachnospiraceae bacterium]